MRALLDINVLIALLDRSHEHHLMAATWFAQNGPAGWASCPLTQNGVARIMSGKGYLNKQPVGAVVARLQSMGVKPEHRFWADNLSILDPAVFDHNALHKGAHITDVYLLALAVKNGGRFVTFDGGFPTNAVVGYAPAHLVKL